MSLSQKFVAISFAALLTATAATPAFAAGFQLKEQGAAGQGASYAGETARAEDAGTVFYNPAGMMELNTPYVASIGISAIDPYANFKRRSVTPGSGGQPNGTNPKSGDAGKLSYVPNLALSARLNDDYRLGLSVNTPFGLSTEYDENWVGRFYAVDSELQTINTTASLARRVNKQVSVAAGVAVQQASARLTSAVNQGAIGQPDGQIKVAGDDVGVGYVASVLYKPRTDTNVGVTYRSRIHHKLKGDITTNGLVGPFATAQPENPGSAKLVTPDVLSVGATHDLNAQWKLLGEVSWTNWSLFNRLRVRDDATGVIRQNIDEDYSDTYFLAVGTQYKVNDKWKLRTGVAYDTGAVDTNHRTFRIPDTDRFWTSVGTSYQFTESMGVDVGYTHIFARTVKVTEDTSVAVGAGSVSGKYSPKVDILSANFNYKF